MSEWKVWSIYLGDYDFAYEGVIIIPSKYGYMLFESNWKKINSVIEGML